MARWAEGLGCGEGRSADVCMYLRSCILQVFRCNDLPFFLWNQHYDPSTDEFLQRHLIDTGVPFGPPHIRVPVNRVKTDVKTAQRSMRYAKSTTTLDLYAQTDMEELIAAQEMMLDAIFSHAGEAVN
jgi:hypothetical protein